MNHQNHQNKSPNNGLEMRQLTFLAVILAGLLVLVLGGFAIVQWVIPLLRQDHTPPIVETPGSNLTEPVTGEQQTAPTDEQPSWLESIFAGILDLFTPGEPDDPNEVLPGNDPNATYPFAANASTGPTLPTGQGKTIADGETNSKYSIVINAKTGEVLAGELADERMYPASMTKVMTLLVAVDPVCRIISQSPRRCSRPWPRRAPRACWCPRTRWVTC